MLLLLLLLLLLNIQQQFAMLPCYIDMNGHDAYEHGASQNLSWKHLRSNVACVGQLGHSLALSMLAGKGHLAEIRMQAHGISALMQPEVDCALTVTGTLSSARLGIRATAETLSLPRLTRDLMTLHESDLAEAAGAARMGCALHRL
jgi:hypothetical protein